MRKIVLLSFLGFNGFVIAENLPSQTCLSLDADKIKPCLDNAHSEWDQKLNETYKSVMSYLDQVQKKELQAQQRSWIKERDKKCEALSTELEKKACYLDETQIKTLALKDQKVKVIPKKFEGDWTDIEKYSGLDIGMTLAQKGENICGAWSYFASRGNPGEIHARLIDQNTAKAIKVCAYNPDPGAPTQVSCDLPYEQWDSNSTIMLKICDGILYSNFENNTNSELFTDCNLLKNSEVYIYKSELKKMTKDDISRFFRNYSWINTCLNYEDQQ